ncbi:MAG: septum formation protein Maf [Ignavibacteriales bacterium]|nr:septum formation protein Maf [Ignavibacteriales bacterium]
MVIDLKIVLASGSPRRKFLLGQIVREIEVVRLDTDESFPLEMHQNDVALMVAKRKMDDAISRGIEGIIVTADTIVLLDGEILGKPADSEEAKSMLRRLSGKTHTVITGFSVFNTQNDKRIDSYSETKVTFTDLTEDEIAGYVKTGSSLDKAGGYGVQDGYGSIFMEKIDGCYYNVMGLPTNSVYEALKKVAF